MPTQVRHVRDALRREFDGLIDLSDVANRSDTEREQHFLSRALAALIVRHLTGCTSGEAADAVIDGRDDNGIDAVAVEDGPQHLWLVQTKWSDAGAARVTAHETRAMIDGVRLIDERAFDRFNDPFQKFADRVRDVLDEGRGKITMVVAAMRAEPLSREVEQVLIDEERRLNTWGDFFDHRLLGARDAWQIIRDGLAEPPIQMLIRMEDCSRVSGPYEAYSGTVEAAEVAQWYADHSSRLFSRNIRTWLGPTPENSSMVRTLVEEPHSFWYFNNGVTVLCDAVSAIPWTRGSRTPVELRLQGATVVNGAQTVAATSEAATKDSEAVGEAKIGVRVISLAGCPPGFPEQIVEATNTQNRMLRRDFIALDAAQAEIRNDFRLSLQKDYVVRRGEPVPPPDAGCSVDEAALALACAHRDPELSARAKNPVLLWEGGGQGAYHLLFAGPPSAWQIWRSVLLVRNVRSLLHNWRRKHQGRAAAIAEQGGLLVAHLLFRQVGLDDIDDPDASWEGEEPDRIAELTTDTLARLAAHVDAAYGKTSYIGSTFANPERCRELAGLVLADVHRGVPASTLPEEYRPATLKRRNRRPNAVPVLVDAERLADGARLEFRAGTRPEREALAAWLAEDPRRGEATWVNERGKPLLWAVDGERYSPSGLVEHMWDLAEWDGRPVAVQGPSQWIVPGEGSLWELALAVLHEREEGRD
ncbi:MAG: AIPR family protein [Nocardioidaceae bacterium]